MAHQRSNKRGERTRQDPKKKMPKFAKRTVAVLLAAALVVLVLTNLNAFSPANIKNWVQENLLGQTTGNGFPVKFTGSTVDYMNFGLSGSQPVVVSDTSVTILDASGGIKTSQQHSYSSTLL